MGWRALLKVENAPGGGSCFSHPAGAGTRRRKILGCGDRAFRPRSLERRSRRQVLVVDDVDVNRDVALAQLQALGLERVWRRMAAHRPPPWLAEGDFDLDPARLP